VVARKGAATKEVEPPTVVEPVRMVNGLKVVEDAEVPSPLGGGRAFSGMRKLSLEDGTQCFGCSACDFAGTRGEVMAHRIAVHNAGKGGPRKRTQYDAVVSVDLLSMSIAELLEYGRQYQAMSDLVDVLIGQRDAQKAEFERISREHSALVAALAKAGFRPPTAEES
jgi:hypothetical protein